jgi:HAD superfamily hydrolase (TIGR01549 family)
VRGHFADYVKKHDNRLKERNEILLPDLFERAMRPFIADPQRRRQLADRLTTYETLNEIAALTVDPDFPEMATALATHPIDLVLITDMYLPRASIENILEALEIRHFFSKVYVSAEVGVTKHSGKLFDVVAADLGIAPQRILHIGDNYINDAEQPRKRTWHARHYFNPERELSRRICTDTANRCLKDPTFRRQSARKLVAPSDATGDLEHLIETTIAPAFLVFTARCLEFAERSSLERLYFMTRDGTVFADIAARLQARLPIFQDGDTDRLRCLALNRSSSMLLTYEGLTPLDWAIHAASYLAQRPFSLGALLEAFNLSPDDLTDLSEKDRTRLDDNLLEENAEAVDKFLKAQPAIALAIDRLLRERKVIVADYLRQEGVLSGGRLGLVDIGYSGTAAKFISNYLMQEDRLETAAATQIHCLFFATNRFFRGNLSQMHPGVVLHDGRMLSYERAEDKTTVLNFGWLEPFAVDPDLGPFLGHRRSDGLIVADFAHPNHADPRRKLRTKILTAIDALIDNMLLAAPFSLDDCEAVVIERLRRFVKSPTARQVRAVEKLAHDFGIVRDREQAVVTRFGLKDVTFSLRHHRARDIWLQGSLRHSKLHWLGPAVEVWGRRAF